MKKNQIVIIGISVLLLAGFIGGIFVIKNGRKVSVNQNTSVKIPGDDGKTTIVVGKDMIKPQPTVAVKGDAWVMPATQNVKAGESFDVNLYVNTNGENLGSFSVLLKYDASLVAVDTERGDDGITKGSKTGDFIVIAEPSNSGGVLKIAGVRAEEGIIDGSKMNIVTVHMKSLAGVSAASANLKISVDELTTVKAKKLLLGSATGAVVEIN